MKPEYEKVPLSAKESVYVNYINRDFFDALWHYHPEYEIILVKKGRGIRFVGDQAGEYSGPDIVALGSDIPHHWKSNIKYRGSEAIVIQFQSEVVNNSFLNLPEFKSVKLLLKEIHFGLKFKSTGIIVDLFTEIRETDGVKRLNAFIRLLSELSITPYERLLRLSYFTLDSKPIDRLEKIFYLIKKHFKEDHKLDYYANEVGLANESFSRYFKQRSGQTFITYLTAYRVGYASKLLKETNMKIIEVAYESGFQNLSNFNRQFRKIKSRSPREYKKWISREK